MNAELNSFETALLTRLREHIDVEPAKDPHFTPARLLLGAAVVVAAATAIVVVVPGLGSGPAYSVAEGNAGTITVEVERLEDAEGLEAELAAYGVHADITYVPNRQECAPGRYTAVDRSLTGMGITMGANLLKVELPPGTVRDGETFVMAVSGAELQSSGEPSDAVKFSAWADFNVAAGPVRPCKPVAASVN